MGVTIGYTVSRVRNSVKAVKEDAFLTDRYIWSLIIKYAKLYMKREDNMNKLKRFRSFWRTVPCLELVEVDKIEACCGGIKSGCTIMRTKDKLPKPFEGPMGPMFRTVSSIDGSYEIYPTEPGTYSSMTKLSSFKFNNQKYYWYLNGYMYFPNIEWEGVKVEGVWEDDISTVACDANDECNDDCSIRQDQEASIPEDLFAEIEQQVLAEILPSAQLPPDQGDDKQNIFR
jgi:hypothetical protein